MANENALEAVGQAEDVIQRLVNERRALENAQQVLRTYRMVKSEMEPALAELDGVKKSVLDTRRELDAVEGQKQSALARAREEVDRFRSEQLEQVNAEIAKTQHLLGEVEEELAELQTIKAEEVVRYKKELAEVNMELVKVKGELETAKREHGVLAEAIAKAAGFFAKESV